MAQHVALVLVLDPRQLARIEKRAGDRNQSTGKEGLLELEEAACDGESGIAANAALAMHDEGLAKHDFVNRRTTSGLVHLGRGLAEQRGMRRDVIVAIQPGQQPYLHIVE